jgi:G3E family GTPase
LQAKKPAGVINEAVRQVALADTIVINKLDLVTSEQLKSVTQYIRAINGFANLVETKRACVDLALILNLNSFSDYAAQNIDTLSKRANETVLHSSHHLTTV